MHNRPRLSNRLLSMLSAGTILTSCATCSTSNPANLAQEQDPIRAAAAACAGEIYAAGLKAGGKTTLTGRPYYQSITQYGWGGLYAGAGVNAKRDDLPAVESTALDGGTAGAASAAGLQGRGDDGERTKQSEVRFVSAI